MKYKQWRDSEYENYKIKEEIKFRYRGPKIQKNLDLFYLKYEDFVIRKDFEIHDKYYEKDLEKYRRIKEETEQWFLDSLY